MKIKLTPPPSARSALAARHAEAGRHRLAAQAYGWAKFPSLADGPKRTALARQVEQYALAAPGFPVEFERRTLTVPYHGGEATLPIHLIAAPGLPADAPVVLASGGVDSWKTDLHGMWEQLALALPARLLLFDIVGTGETAHLPMTPDGGAEVIAGLVAFARTIGNGKVGHFGISMGGYCSARTGLTGAVDASVVLGGPVERSFAPGRGFAFGMDGIVGNALGFDAMPSTAAREEAFAAFGLRPLLDQNANGPMLVVNGTEDVHVPLDDTLVFEGRRDTRVELIPDTGHCAISRFDEAMAVIAPWLKDTLIG
ncbi:alpha/beta hydrolase [Streptomyces sp. CB01580]|uniref:alpha/beta hydrolase n=1 Tax=Streptomyces sp. CB01580 TaxID=1703933 RepID=UPI00093D6933|nr:alpha/beta hydrolase [Streptomyces sp. CB01580]